MCKLPFGCLMASSHQFSKLIVAGSIWHLSEQSTESKEFCVPPSPPHLVNIQTGGVNFVPKCTPARSIDSVETLPCMIFACLCVSLHACALYMQHSRLSNTDRCRNPSFGSVRSQTALRIGSRLNFPSLRAQVHTGVAPAQVTATFAAAAAAGHSSIVYVPHACRLPL